MTGAMVTTVEDATRALDRVRMDRLWPWPLRITAESPPWTGAGFRLRVEMLIESENGPHAIDRTTKIAISGITETDLHDLVRRIVADLARLKAIAMFQVLPEELPDET